MRALAGVFCQSLCAIHVENKSVDLSGDRNKMQKQCVRGRILYSSLSAMQMHLGMEIHIAIEIHSKIDFASYCV